MHIECLYFCPHQAAEMRIVEEVHRWHSLVQDAMVWLKEGLSRFEQARLSKLLIAISAHQEEVKQRRIASMTQMVREGIWLDS